MDNEEKILELLSKLSESQLASSEYQEISNERLASIESSFRERLDAWGTDLSGDIKIIAGTLTELFASVNGLYASVNGLYTHVQKEHEKTRAHISTLARGQTLLAHQLDSAQNQLYDLENERTQQ